MTAPALLAARGLALERQGRLLLHPLDLELPAQGAVALVGPNGAGKSTLLGLLAGQLQPTQGQVLWQGAPLTALNAGQRAQRIGYMPQRFEPFWDVTLTDIVDMRVRSRTAAQRILHEAGLQRLAGQRWSTLSGGERARGLLAAVLATDPPALLADEPGAALDVQHRLALVESLAARGRQRLVLVVMHDLDLAFECFDRVIVVHEGGIALDGTPGQLLHHPRLDHVFGVRFERIDAPPQTLLRARRAAPPPAHEDIPHAH